MSNERILVSRNKREGKYIAGWCHNPSYSRTIYKATGKLVAKKRAGGHFNLTVIRSHLGKTYVRIWRGE